MKQFNYIKINASKYKNSDLKFFRNEIKNPKDEDLKIANDILKFHSEIGSIDMGGAWKYYNENTRSQYVSALAEKNDNLLAFQLCNMFQTECSSAIITPSINVSNDHDLISQMSWDLDSCAEFTRNKYKLDILESGDTGSSFGVIRDNIKILPDSPRHLYFADLLMSRIQNSNENILEIGGGYGGLVYFLKKIGFNGTYFNIDLPETLFVSYYYLRKKGYKVNLISKKSEIKKGEINLIPSNFYNKLIKEIDFSVFFNSASLSEMSQDICFNYIKAINLKMPRDVIHCNSNYLAFPNSKIHVEILAKDFPWDSNYKLISQYISPFQGASGRYRVYLYETN